MSLPILHLHGSAYDQGRQHGVALRDQIAANLDIYFERFELEGKLPADEARARAAEYRSVLQGHPYYAALQGMADGSGLSLLDLLVLNLRYELLYYQFGVTGVPLVDGCTAFAIQPEAADSGHLLLGQNWDWIPQVLGAVVHTCDEDGFETLSFTEAGIVGGKIGLNTAGLGLAINGLISSADDWSRRAAPFHVRCYDILRSRDLQSAISVVAGTRRACSTNFALVQVPDQAIDLEAAPDTLRRIPPTGGRLVHTNHFLDPSLLGITEPTAERRPHSYSRQARMHSLLDARQPVSIGDLEACLQDHDDFPDSICRHANLDDPADERYITVTSVIMDLQERSLRLTDGQPCQHVYEGVSLAHTALLGR